MQLRCRDLSKPKLARVEGPESAKQSRGPSEGYHLLD